MPTFAEYFADLETEVLRVGYPAPQVTHAVPLLHAIYELAREPEGNPKGVVIFTATPTLAEATWLAVSQQVLDDLDYASLADWATAASMDTFIREEDRESVRTHIDPVAPSPGIYSPWVLRGIGGGMSMQYREMRAQGMNLVTPAGQVRITLLWRP